MAHTSNPTTEIAKTKSSYALKAADAVWIATALLHKQNPEHDRFSTERIVADVRTLHLTEATERTIWQHVNQHCVANREPNPNRSRMLFALGKGDRRLYRNGDKYSVAREGSPTHPDWTILPVEYRDLRAWYEGEWNGNKNDPLLALVGTWTFGPAKEYLREIRDGWEGRP